MGETVELVGPDGETLARAPHLPLTQAEAVLLRAYRRFLEAHDLQEALHCRRCGASETRADGVRAFVGPVQILIQCRCRAHFYHGATP